MNRGVVEDLEYIEAKLRIRECYPVKAFRLSSAKESLKSFPRSIKKRKIGWLFLVR